MCEWFKDCECCDCCECETCCENNCQCWYNYYKFVKCFNLFNYLIICCVSLNKCIVFSIICFIYFLYKRFLEYCCKKKYEHNEKVSYLCCKCYECCNCCECCESYLCHYYCECCECCECYEYCDDCQCCECYECKCIECWKDCLLFKYNKCCCECHVCNCIECCKDCLHFISDKCCCIDNKNIKINNSEISLPLIENEID